MKPLETPIWSLGLMSGTSMDGVDAALVRTDGEDALEFGEARFTAYNHAVRKVLRREMSFQASGAADPTHTQAAAEAVVEQHKMAIKGFKTQPELIGFHGQTVFHAPDEGRTVQLGDGETLSSVPVVWDFRSSDMAAGGEGAPLAPFFHFALARKAKLSEPVAFLNLGGVGNVTWVDPRASAPEDPSALLAFDTGPANALVDDFVSVRSGRSYDNGGKLAAQGTVDWSLVEEALTQPYFGAAPPKSLDRDTFAMVLDKLEGHSLEDGAATLTALSSEAVVRATRFFPRPISRLFLCGGGRKNATLRRMISDGLAMPAEPVETLGFDGDMLEAQAFAYLAVRVLRGLPTSSPSTTGCSAPVCGGQISGYFQSSGA